MRKKFQDSAVAPIIAWDFDGTINIDGESTYPICGSIRNYTKGVINLLHEIGVKNIIWTSRDIAYVQEEGRIYDDLTPMIEFLDNNDINYDAINKSVQFSPWHVNSRKVYAHMYVDDRAFGWYENSNIMLTVLEHILCGILDVRYDIFVMAWNSIYNNQPVEEGIMNELKYAVEHWKD